MTGSIDLNRLQRRTIKFFRGKDESYYLEAQEERYPF